MLGHGTVRIDLDDEINVTFVVCRCVSNVVVFVANLTYSHH